MLILALVFIVVTSLILGIGAPTTANYMSTSTHMCAFYFGMIADITSPVALAAFAGADRLFLQRAAAYRSRPLTDIIDLAIIGLFTAVLYCKWRGARSLNLAQADS